VVAGAIKSGKLVQVLEPYAPLAPGVFLYYPGHRQIMPKLRAFIDHVKQRGRASKRPDGNDLKKRGAKKR
jgi:DNA-binding transcriptional LysR family regulator